MNVSGDLQQQNDKWQNHTKSLHSHRLCLTISNIYVKLGKSDSHLQIIAEKVWPWCILHQETSTFLPDTGFPWAVFSSSPVTLGLWGSLVLWLSDPQTLESWQKPSPWPPLLFFFFLYSSPIWKLQQWGSVFFQLTQVNLCLAASLISASSLKGLRP